MSVFLATAAFILMLVAPFLVIIAVIAAIACGTVALLRGLATARPMRAMIGAAVLAAGILSAFTLVHWTMTKPPVGDTSSAHAWVYDAWDQTRLRFTALTWMSDGTFERLTEQQRQ